MNAPAAPARSRAITVVAWVLQALLALVFLGAGLGKLTGSKPMVDMFEELGAGQWLRYVVGLLEVAAAVGLLIPLLAAFTAACCALLLVCAVIASLTVLDDSPLFPLGALVVAIAIIALRRHDLVTLRQRIRPSSA